MRDAFRDRVYELALQDPRVVLLSGDIGNRMFDKFKAQMPDRFYNVGVAEQNMIGMAAGLAMAGMRPVCYTIANFITYRVIEQIRIDGGYHHQPILIAGVGGGLSYASLGATHHTCEDIAMLRSIPGMTILTPADPPEVRACVDAAMTIDHGPTYIRLGKKGEPALHDTPPTVTPGKWLPMKHSDAQPRIALLCMGNLMPEAVSAASTLRTTGHKTALWSCVSIKPMDNDVLAHVFQHCDLVVTLEEHGLIGGLAGAVSEWISEQPRHALRATLLKVGTRDEFLHRTGSQDYARQVFGLTAPHIVQRITATLS